MYLGKAEELLKWSADLRGLQLPRLPASIPHPWFWHRDTAADRAEGQPGSPGRGCGQDR
jgi:hypothetical protein